MLKSPMEKVTVLEAKETGHQNLGSRPYHYAFWYTRFMLLFVLPTQSTKFWNHYPIISISKEQIHRKTSSFECCEHACSCTMFFRKAIFVQKQLRIPMLEHKIHPTDLPACEFPCPKN